MHDPDYCPYCGSPDIIGDSVDMEGAAAYQPCACEECGKEWTVEYRAVYIHTETTEDNESKIIKID